MTIDPNIGVNAGLIDRVKNILLTPRAEWDRIEPEAADVNKLYMGYVLPLAALGAICGIIGMSVFGVGALGIHVRVPIVEAVISGVIQTALYVAGVFVIALIANALAPTFGSTPNQGQAHKLMAYSFTAALLSGVFMIFPPLAVLGLLGLYSFALLFIGLPKMMKTPDDKRMGYFATLVIVGIVVFIVMGAITGYVRMATAGFGGAPGYSFGQQSAPSSANLEGSVNLPGGGAIELSEIEKMGQQGAVRALSPDQMQALLPQGLPGGFTLASASASQAMGVTQAEGTYNRGDSSIRLTVVNMGEMGAIASMAGAMGVTESRQDADGYSRTNTVDGRVVTEQMSRGSNSASYGIVGRGVAVTADGNGVTVDEVRGAVEAIGVPRLEAMVAQ
ncbi:protein of unknown function DUF1282 [alpha proteobacterium U9-1i]|nr:protein of unknown function DUF1282 [alpha proteobacterium U9-1i]